MTRTKLKRRRAYLTAVPLVLVNIVAFSGQFGYITSHVHWPVFGQVVFALALESIALFLAYMAHQALMAEDTAYGLRVASYLFGLLIGAMNYSHYAPGMHPTFEAVATGLMSLASPWLWGIYSRRQSRDVLKAKELIEPRAVKLGALRWLLWTSQSWRVFRRAVWLGVSRPSDALTLYVGTGQPADVENELDEPLDTPELDAAPPTATASSESLPPGQSSALTAIEMAQTKADAVRAALAELGDSVTAAMVAGWLGEHGWDVTPAHVRVIKSKARHADTASTGAI